MAQRDERLEPEGIPEVEEHPPGTDIEIDSEGIIPPRDHPIAASDDPAYPTTVEEERLPESVVDRAMREEPDVGAAELGVGGGVQGAEHRLRRRRRLDRRDDVAIDLVDLPLEPDDDVELATVELIDPETVDELGTGDPGELIGLEAEDEVSAAPEEVALHIERER